MEARQGLHPSVQQFKQFMNERPWLMNEVKEGRKTLQNLFEEWSVLGENHEQWQSYTDPDKSKQTASTAAETSAEPPSTPDSLSQIFAMIKGMNVQDLQSHLAQFNSVLSNIQNVMQTFQRPNNEQKLDPQDHPFSFRRD